MDRHDGTELQELFPKAHIFIADPDECLQMKKDCPLKNTAEPDPG